MEVPSDEKMSWRIRDVAEYFGTTRNNVYRWMRQAENPLPHYRPGGGVARFIPKEVREWGTERAYKPLS